MKKVTFIIAIFCAITVNAQNYLISFAGKGGSTTVSTVKVENLMKSTTLELNGSDVLHLKGTVGIASVENQASRQLKIYPNPMTDHSTLEIYPPVAGDASISIYEISGKQLFNHKSFLENCKHEFRISGLNNGLYLIIVKGNAYHISGKLLSSSNTYGNLLSLQKISSNRTVEAKQFISEEKGSLTTVDMDYTEGDRLKFTAVSGTYRTVFMDVPTQNKTITFNFVACTDRDNNNYPIVEIGTQIWTAENLKTTKYNDETPIPLVSDSLQWLGLSGAGFSWYRNNETKYKDTYGALYNFYAASSGKLCPTGWRVSTDEDWTTLNTFLGGTGSAGGKLKESGNVHWQQPNTGATNESGFTGLPGGWRGSTSKFSEILICGEFWTSTPNTYDNGGYSYYLDYWYKAIYRENVNKKVGFSIRCVKE
jgi:uncharacterized protein (TIGR02145 family)